MAAIKDLFLVVTTTTLLFLRIVVSSPVPLAQDGSIPDPPCDPVSTYSPEWFLANVNDDYRRNSSVFENRLLFYTRRCTDDAIRLSCSSDGFYITIWNVCKLEPIGSCSFDDGADAEQGPKASTTTSTPSQSSSDASSPAPRTLRSTMRTCPQHLHVWQEEAQL